ncbi:DUF3152 domain-containing protein [Streptomyces sp. NPDC059248]|uniref:DUF3152 domain-containing protein n=1 Tax=Streptomyces sp. NPDC059248 TaxID=3346791 RepID=UPI0036C8D869
MADRLPTAPRPRSRGRRVAAPDGGRGARRPGSRRARRRRSPAATAVRALLLLVCTGAVGWAGLALLPISGSAGSGSADAGSARSGSADARDTAAEPSRRSAPGPGTSGRAAPATEEPSRGDDRPQARVRYQENGPGTYTWARGTGERAGSGGRLIRYGVKLEDGTGLDADDVAAEIHDILRHPRGWTRHGVASFQRVDSPPYDMLVHVVSPGTTDELCGAWGLDTRGQVNCANAPDLVVNVRRWVDLSDQYRGRPDDYHALIINHEAGHVLGYGHRDCPGDGRLAPAMMQQIKGLKGCVANPWVYDTSGRLIDGPKVP